MTASAPLPTAMIAPAAQPVALVLRGVKARSLDAALIRTTPSLKKGDQVALVTLEALEAAAAANPQAPVGSLPGRLVYVISILNDRAEYADQPTAEAVGDSRGVDKPIPKDRIDMGQFDAPSPRVVNAAIYYADDPPDLVPATESLALAGRYCLQVDIGARKADSRLPSDIPALPEPAIDVQGLDLFVSVTTRGNALRFAAPTQVLHLPQRGDSAPVNFSFEAAQLSPDTPIWVHVYYNWVLLQTVEIHVAVTSPAQDLPAALPSSATYSRSAGFADLEALRPNEVVLVMRQDGDGYRISLAWPGDGTAGGRRDPVRGLAATLPINANDLASVVLEVRNLLYNITWLPTYRAGQRGKLADRRESLYQLAVAGNRLYSLLFNPPAGTTEQAAALAALRQWLETVANAPAGGPPASGSRPAVQIVHEEMPAGIPWGLVYPAIVNGPDDVKADLFWGCRYRLEILTPQLAENAKTKPAEREAVAIVGGTYNFRVAGETGVVEVTAEHRKAIGGLQGRKAITVDLREQADQGGLSALLGDGDVVYMFCHGHTAKTPDDSSDWVARFKDQMAKLTPDLREKYADLFKLQHDNYQPNDPYINDSWLKWNSSLLPLSKLTQWNLQLPRKPLVMLNMCESAQVLPTLNSGFIPFFSRIGARGVLGTECPMLAPFAAAFGQKVLERLVAGEAIGDILPALRRQFIEEDRNPLGLAYTYYGDADLTMINDR